MASASPVLVGNRIFHTSGHAPGHPLAIPRVSLCVDLCRILGWLDDASYVESPPPATPEQLARYHTPEYVSAVIAAERQQWVSVSTQERFNIGINGNPVYKEIFRRPATACGATLHAARMLRKGGIVYNPAGGTHHGLRDRASGFCMFNDPVLGILEMLDAGLTRVFYLDVDAHFGDGVQRAFHDDGRVFTLSVHEAGRWPMRRGSGEGREFGGVDDRAGGGARNLPVPGDFNDTEMAYLLDAAIVPLIEAFAPECVVVVCGADALADDPMAKLGLSNRALWRVIEVVKPLATRLLVLGGGGYNPWAVARCWTGVWATLNRIRIPERLPAEAEGLLRTVHWSHRYGRNPPDHWFTTLADKPRSGPLRSEIRELAATVMSSPPAY